jgi:hypothetical protein
VSVGPRVGLQPADLSEVERGAVSAIVVIPVKGRQRSEVGDDMARGGSPVHVQHLFAIDGEQGRQQTLLETCPEDDGVVFLVHGECCGDRDE